MNHLLAHHTLTDGKEKYIWLAVDGREQFFRLTDDPHGLHDLSRRPEGADRITYWRNELIERLLGGPEAFTDGQRLIAGRPFPPLRQAGTIADADKPCR